jgi:hypothetical protein
MTRVKTVKRRIMGPVAALFIAAVLALAFTYASDKVWPPKEGDCNAVARYVR